MSLDQINKESNPNIFMQAALEQAKLGYQEGGIPIGSVLVYQGKILGQGHNQRIQKGSSTLHAEIDALENAGRLSAAVYKNCTLYTTLSPCSMCSGAILLYGIPKVIIGEHQTFMGEEDLLRSRNVEVVVINDLQCILLMQKFIQEKPLLWNEDIGK